MITMKTSSRPQHNRFAEIHKEANEQITSHWYRMQTIPFFFFFFYFFVRNEICRSVSELDLIFMMCLWLPISSLASPIINSKWK
jgi:hypothetical protein